MHLGGVFGRWMYQYLETNTTVSISIALNIHMYGIQRHGSLTEAKPRQFTGHATADQHVWRSLTAKTAYQEAQGKKFSAKRSGAHATAQGIETLGKEASPLNSTFFTIAPLLSRLFHFGRRTRGDKFCSELRLCAAVRRASVFFPRGPFFSFFFFFFRHYFLFRILDKDESSLNWALFLLLLKCPKASPAQSNSPSPASILRPQSPTARQPAIPLRRQAVTLPWSLAMPAISR